MWIHQTGDMYECSNCGMIEHIKPLWTRCPICGEPGERTQKNDLPKWLEEAIAHNVKMMKERYR